MIRGIGTQTWRVIDDNDPAQGFALLKETGFDCCDFSLNRYLLNTDLYNKRRSRFFEKSAEELRDYFRPHKEGAKAAGIRIHQIHPSDAYALSHLYPGKYKGDKRPSVE